MGRWDGYDLPRKGATARHSQQRWCGKRASFFEPVYFNLKTINLPRQARDKHTSENLRKRGVFPAGEMTHFVNGVGNPCPGGGGGNTGCPNNGGDHTFTIIVPVGSSSSSAA
jgi:hypothetical protein